MGLKIEQVTELPPETEEEKREVSTTPDNHHWEERESESENKLWQCQKCGLRQYLPPSITIPTSDLPCREPRRKP